MTLLPLLWITSCTPAQATEPTQDQVQLLDPGQAPRTPLRLHYQKGQLEQGAMTMKMDMQISMNGTPLPSPDIPTMVMGMSMRAEKIKRDFFDYSFALLWVDLKPSPDTPAELMIILQSNLQDLIGMEGTGRMDNRGQSLGEHFTLPKDASAQMKSLADQMQQSMSKVSSPLPESPVGLGASWQVHQETTQSGLPVHQTATYHLTKIEGDHIELDVDVTTQPGPGPYTMAGLPPDAKVTDLQFNMTGKGHTILELDRLFPLEARTTIGGTLQTTIEQAGQTIISKVDLSIDVGMVGEQVQAE